MAKHGRSYVEARQKIDREREYAPHDAVRLVKESKRAKFDESVEVHIRTGLNVRHADEQLRGTIALPHGLGKDVKIAVFAKGDLRDIANLKMKDLNAVDVEGAERMIAGTARSMGISIQ